MNIWRGSRWSLQTWIMILTVLITASVFAVTDYITMRSSVAAVEKTAGKQTSLLAQQLADSLEESKSLPKPPAWFHQNVKELFELEPNIKRVDVYVDNNGKLELAESSSALGDRALEGKEIAAFFSGEDATFTVDDEGPRSIFSIHHLLFGNGNKGFLTVVSSLQAVDAIADAHAQIRLIALAASTLLQVGAILLLFRKTVYKSIRHLVDVMHLFKAGDNSARVSRKMPGEFGELARHLNGLLEEVQRFNEELRQRVTEATSELAARNRELQDLNLLLFDAQKRLAQAERLSLAGQLTATFAHEVGSPLSAISTHLQLLMENTQLEPKFKDRLVQASEQVDRVCGIVESLLSKTRQAPTLVEIKLDEIIRNVAHLVSPTMEARSIQFELRNRAGSCSCLGSPDQMQQLFLNLFNNSLDAMIGPGVLTVELSRMVNPDKKGFLRINFCDTGIGILPEKQVHIFEPFFTTKESGKGVGLGLSVCREIVQGHGGQITVTSQPGAGSCFTIVLPERSAANGEAPNLAKLQECG